MEIFHAWGKCGLADLKNSFYLLIFSAKNKSLHNHIGLLARLNEISKVVSVGVEGKKFSKRRQHDVLLVLLSYFEKIAHMSVV